MHYIQTVPALAEASRLALPLSVYNVACVATAHGRQAEVALHTVHFFLCIRYVFSSSEFHKESVRLCGKTKPVNTHYFRR